MLSLIASGSVALRAPALRMTVGPQIPSGGLVTPQQIGNYNFDPLNLGTDETFIPFREAEIKHGRLAMLAAIAWPLQEILHPILVDAARADGLGVRDGLAASAGKSPSLLNGGLNQWELAPALSLFVFVGAVLELQDIKARKQLG